MITTLRRYLLTALTCLAPILSAHAASDPAVQRSRESFVSGGRRISVETFAPVKPGRHPAVLVLYTSAGKLAGMGPLRDFSASLVRQGMVAFVVDYFDRTGTWFAGDETIEKHLHTWEATIGEALDFAAAHPRVDSRSIGIFGYSLGAFLAVSTANRDRRVDAVAEVAGGMFDYLGGRLQRVPPTLILHGTADQRVNVRYAHALDRVARGLGTWPVVHLYPGEGHVLSEAAMTDARQRALRFLSSQLQPAARRAR